MIASNNNIRSTASLQRAMEQLATVHIKWAIEWREKHLTTEQVMFDLRMALKFINKMPDTDKRKRCRSQWFKAFNQYRNQFITRR